MPGHWSIAELRYQLYCTYDLFIVCLSHFCKVSTEALIGNGILIDDKAPNPAQAETTRHSIFCLSSGLENMLPIKNIYSVHKPKYGPMTGRFRVLWELIWYSMLFFVSSIPIWYSDLLNHVLWYLKALIPTFDLRTCISWSLECEMSKMPTPVIVSHFSNTKDMEAGVR